MRLFGLINFHMQASSRRRHTYTLELLERIQFNK